mmetsp:Transcript_19071/g.29259  ORF Transcript_19071/g.29259 Transcript_19071/m.29259 type:complete len:225 (-) Transcript_19071:1005-1679(-)|eukprot:CAMPEP_0170504598 /NCGR_PEP_ID=MMETSP0208-20121228/48359_1 /TAXON_ID=197538 /ORGANISM="Strombidium inclinatum, Strain S3" /LENGTH=224 /DNA_ID=CAMNT_0010784947 /DNA_START=938 /DNA_END=1612 /DNA_ORIENTATION=+
MSSSQGDRVDHHEVVRAILVEIVEKELVEFVFAGEQHRRHDGPHCFLGADHENIVMDGTDVEKGLEGLYRRELPLQVPSYCHHTDVLELQLLSDSRQGSYELIEFLLVGFINEVFSIAVALCFFNHFEAEILRGLLSIRIFDLLLLIMDCGSELKEAASELLVAPAHDRGAGDAVNPEESGMAIQHSHNLSTERVRRLLIVIDLPQALACPAVEAKSVFEDELV